MGQKKHSSRYFSISVIFTFIAFVFVVLSQWISFFPLMEEVGEETEEFLERGSGNEGSVTIIRSNVISEIRQAQAVSFICFGILDGIFAFLLWKRPVPKKHEGTLTVLGYGYFYIRWFSAFVIIMVSIVIITSSVSPSTLYLVTAIFSGISLLFILYFRKSISSNKLNADVVFKDPNEIVS